MRRNTDKEVETFIDSIRDLWRYYDPLDGDGVDMIAEKIRQELDYPNGNIH